MVKPSHQSWLLPLAIFDHIADLQELKQQVFSGRPSSTQMSRATPHGRIPWPKPFALVLLLSSLQSLECSFLSVDVVVELAFVWFPASANPVSRLAV